MKCYGKVVEHIVSPNGFDFNKTHHRKISTEGYVIYQMAKTIWTGKEYIKLWCRTNRNIAFKVIINALLITRYDADIFLITK